MRSAMVDTIVRREVLEIVRNRLLVASMVIPPIILIAAPLALSRLAADAGETLPAGFAAQVLASRPSWASLAPTQLVAAYSLQQFLAIFLIMPAYVPLSIATFSIVGEKQSHSLEAVLATPIRTSELLAGKSIAAVVPGVLTAWFSYGILVGLAGLLLGPQLSAVLADRSWLAAVFLLGPAIGIVSCVAGIIVSSRVNDARVAQQIGGVVILPFASIAVLQAVSGYLFGVREYLVATAVTGVAGLAGIGLAVFLFGRESILTRWR